MHIWNIAGDLALRIIVCLYFLKFQTIVALVLYSEVHEFDGWILISYAHADQASIISPVAFQIWTQLSLVLYDFFSSTF